MKTNNRLSATIHALVNLANRREPTSTDALAASLEVNPVVLRQTLGGLRDAGLVRAEPGNTMWSLGRDAASITVGDIYVALGEPSLFVLRNRSDNPECLVERAVNEALSGAFEDAQRRLIERLGSVSLASLSEDVH
jgi:DNA-binding IscR family transcriptional regulator